MIQEGDHYRTTYAGTPLECPTWVHPLEAFLEMQGERTQVMADLDLIGELDQLPPLRKWSS